MIRYILTDNLEDCNLELETFDKVCTTIPTYSIKNNDVCYNMITKEYFEWGNSLPNWAYRFICPTAIQQNIMNTINVEDVKLTMLKIGYFTNIRIKLEKDRKISENRMFDTSVRDQLLCNSLNSVYVDEDGYDTIHYTRGTESYKSLRTMFQKTIPKTNSIFYKSFLGKERSEKSEWNIMFVYQTLYPLSIAFITKDDFETSIISENICKKENGGGITIQIPFSKLTFIIHPDEKLSDENIILDPLPEDLRNLQWENLRDAIIKYK